MWYGDGVRGGAMVWEGGTGYGVRIAQSRLRLDYTILYSMLLYGPCRTRRYWPCETESNRARIGQHCAPILASSPTRPGSHLMPDSSRTAT